MVHQVRKLLGFCELVTGVFIIACGLVVAIDYFYNRTPWQISIKAPVWLAGGFLFGLIGWYTIRSDE